MNLGTLRQAFYDHQRISAAHGHVTASEATRILNEKQSELHAEILAKYEGFFQVTTTLSETAGVESINLPVDLYKICWLERIAGYGTSATDPSLILRMPRTGAARYHARRLTYPSNGVRSEEWYYPVGQKQIVLSPAPDASRTDSLRLVYAYRPAAMTDDSHEPFQQVAGQADSGEDNLADWHHLIWMRAALVTIAKEGAGPEYQMLRMEVDRIEASMHATLASVSEDPVELGVQASDEDLFDY